MRMERIIRTFTTLRNKVEHKPIQRSFVRNLNLCFDAGPLLLFVQPLHPKLQKHKPSSIVVDSKSPVLAFAFVPKPTDTSNMNERWENCSNMYFRFQQIGYLLDIEPGQGASHRFLSPIHELQQTEVSYKVTDLAKQKQIEFTIEGQKSFKASTSHSAYESIQEIIKNSLMDMSGLRLCLDLRREEQLYEVRRNLEKRIVQSKEKQDFFPSS